MDPIRQKQLFLNSRRFMSKQDSTDSFEAGRLTLRQRSSQLAWRSTPKIMKNDENETKDNNLS